ncbi:MAG: hypothetical protein JWQ80_2125 [Massilia sp.]|nr:hypothetical protein [Massilia sp.]
MTVSGCVLDVVNCGPQHANHGILVAGNTGIEDITILGTTVYHRGGGSAGLHGIRCETYGGGATLTGLRIQGNRVSPPPGEAVSANRGAIGIYLVNGVAARLERNSVTGMLSGIFVGSGDRNRVTDNDCSTNMNFGIHVTGFARSFLIESNTCNHNGGPDSPNYWGRGIELSAAAGPNAVSDHTIRFNTCRFNYNYGGPLDNGTEGVGIGLDDGVVRCTVYRNHVANNEGNGIQLFGGGAPGSIPDTGGHTIAGNLLGSNCTYSVLDRRSGGTAPSRFQAHIQLAYIYGTRTLITNNIFAGPTRGGVYLDSTSSNVVVVNNVCWGTPYPASATGLGHGQGTAAGLPVAGVL